MIEGFSVAAHIEHDEIAQLDDDVVFLYPRRGGRTALGHHIDHATFDVGVVVRPEAETRTTDGLAASRRSAGRGPVINAIGRTEVAATGSAVPRKPKVEAPGPGAYTLPPAIDSNKGPPSG